MKKYGATILVVVIFLCGLSLFLYPVISNMYNEYLNRKLIGDYHDSFEEILPEEYEEAKADAVAYNENKDNEAKLKELDLTYEEVLNVAGNGIMGYIEIPKISVSLVIYHSIEENVLQRGLGHVEGTALPVGGVNTHCVLAGHTGLPSAKLLTNMDHLKLGDVFYLHVLDEVLEYRIEDISVVEPDEVSRLNVLSGKDCVTLVTCTPYGINSHRLLVRGVRANSSDNLYANGLFVQNDLLYMDMEYLIIFSLLGLAVVFVIVRKIVTARRKKAVKEKGGDE